ncbi:MAG: SpoIIE family protein phosphatase [Flavobacteriales bacterium]|nr:SpoIIE family protein phosphatase [Flavobacteriales bacterium]
MRLTIGKRIGAGFGILVLAMIIVFARTYYTLSESRKINEQITKIYNPSVHVLENLNLLIVESKMLIMNWMSVQISDDDDKLRLKDLIADDYPALKERVLLLAVNWTEDEQAQIRIIMRDIDDLFVYLEDIMSQLNTFESYEDPMVVFMIKPMVEGGEVDILASKILSDLGVIVLAQQENTNVVSDKMINSFGDLEFVVRTLGIALVIGGLLIALFTVRSIVKPVQELKGSLLLLGKGMIPEKKTKISQDEIGEMSLAMNDLVEGFTRTTQFANEVGAGNFESDYKPLSTDDTLGHALLRMREDLHESERILERKVEERTLEVVRQKEEIEDQNNEITASIRYAKRIQESILPDLSVVNRALKDYFILYKPKDIVSGDFYWIGQQDGKALFAAVDCTGHGVPGAFMSLIGSALLKEAVVEHGKMEPASILNELNKLAGETINQTFEESTVKDGMDIAFCTLDYATNELQYAGAYNQLYVIRKDNPDNLSKETRDLLEDTCIAIKESSHGYILLEVRANKFPIGVFVGEEVKEFTNNKLQLQKGDVVYIFSDGFVDQFGGPKGRKFMAKRFRPTLLSIQNLSLVKQGDYLDKVIEGWMKPNGTEETVYEQIDDILVMGVKV